MRGSSSRGSIRGFRGGGASSGSSGPRGSSSSSSSNNRNNSLLKGTAPGNGSARSTPSIQPSSSTSKANPALIALGYTSGGIGGTWGKARDPTGRISQFKSDSDKCPICNNARYFAPNLILKISTCYHIACTSCIDRLFSQGPNDCPTCAMTIRKNDFGFQTFEDLQVEKEIDVRRRVAKLFDKKQDDFQDVSEWNAYLEMVEEITFNLIHDLEMQETADRIEAYKAKEKHTPDLLISSNPTAGSTSSDIDPTSNSLSSSAAYLSEDLENSQRKARANRDLNRKERDNQLKKSEEKEIMKFLESGSGASTSTSTDNSVEKIKQKYRDKKEWNEKEDEKEDDYLNRIEKERQRERALQAKNKDLSRKRRKLNGGGSKEVEKDRIGVDGKINGRDWSLEMLWDFKGPLATLEDTTYLWDKDLKEPTSSLYGGSTGDHRDNCKASRIEEQLSIGKTCWDEKYAKRARAGGFDYRDWWARGSRCAVETVGIGMKREG